MNLPSSLAWVFQQQLASLDGRGAGFLLFALCADSSEEGVPT